MSQRKTSIVKRAFKEEGAQQFMPEDKQNTDFARFFAVILIANSHLDGLYPIHALATGGAIGNALFFMLSGYGLMISEKKRNSSFLPWYGRRILRIYPSLIISVFLLSLGLCGAWKNLDWTDCVKSFIWPTPAWFISAIMIFYIIFFPFMKFKRPQVFLLGMFILALPYLYLYMSAMDLTYYSIEGPSYFKWIFYFQVMLFGGFLAARTKAIGEGRSVHAALLFLFTLLYYGILLIIQQGYGGQYQAIIHLLTFPIIYLCFMISRSFFVNHTVMGNRKIASIATFISAITLEIYFLQGFFYSHPLIQSLNFPFNIITFWIAVSLFAFALSKVAQLFKSILFLEPLTVMNIKRD